MRTLTRVVMEGMESSVPLPAPFRKWHMNDALLYRGAVSVVAGPPGCGKTITALNIVNNLRVPTLYISNDSTRYTVAKRTFSMLTGLDHHMAAHVIENTPNVASDVFEEWGSIQFDFASSPSIEDIAMQGEAFREKFGEYPALTVVDILMNVNLPGLADTQNYWGLFPKLKNVAREQNTALLGVHHTSESAKYDPCPPKSSLMGKANQLPELIITQVMMNGKIFYAIVKNRNGTDDPTGETYMTLSVDASRCQIDDSTEDDLVFRDGPGVPMAEKIREEMGDF